MVSLLPDDQKKKKMMRNDLTKEQTVNYFKKDKPEKKIPRALRVSILSMASRRPLVVSV